jgi:hypothetical protein
MMRFRWLVGITERLKELSPYLKSRSTMKHTKLDFEFRICEEGCNKLWAQEGAGGTDKSDGLEGLRRVGHLKVVGE